MEGILADDYIRFFNKFIKTLDTKQLMMFNELENKREKLNRELEKE